MQNKENMSFKLSKRSNIAPPPIRKIFQQLPAIAEKRKAEGLTPLIDLSIGQPHVAANPEVMENLRKMDISSSQQGYSPAQGEAATLRAIAQLYNHYYRSVQYINEYVNEEVMVTVGASGALSNIFSVLVEKEEDEILTFEPFFGTYTGQVKEWNGSLVMIPTQDNQFRPTAKALEAALRAHPDAKAIILNYPNNPSGISLTRLEVVELSEVLKKFPKLLVILDDVYRDFNYQEHITILDVAPELKDRCIVINSGAKGLLGAPGERLGMIAAHEQLIKAMALRQTNGLSSVPFRTQAALRFAVASHLNNPANDWLVATKREYKNNVETAAIAFKQQGFLAPKPDGAFYLLICAKHLLGTQLPKSKEVLKTDIDIANYFLHEAGVAMVPGSGFGIEPTQGYLRISCAKDNSLLLEAAMRIGKAAQLLIKPLPAPSAWHGVSFWNEVNADTGAGTLHAREANKDIRAKL